MHDGVQGMTGDLAVEQHLHDMKLRGSAELTVYARGNALTRMAGLLGCPLLEASAGQLLAWRESLDLAPSTIVRYVSHAREFYRWAAAAGLIEANRAAGLPVPPLARLLPRPIGEEDLAAALAAAPARIRPWLVLAGWAGLRAKEIALIRRECVLDSAVAPVLVIAADATKGHRERVVPMSGFVLGELRAAGLPRAGWVFRRADGRPGPNRPWTISHLVNDHLHDCGIAETLQQLRHRFGTGVYRARRDIRVTQELLGHSSPSTTAGYAAYDQEDAAAAVEALPVPGLRAVG